MNHNRMRYGKRRQIIEYIKAKPFSDSSRIALTCNKNNNVAKALCEILVFSVAELRMKMKLAL